MAKYADLTHGPTPQTDPLFGATQVQNQAGGYVFPVDRWEQLRRWVVLGSEGGTYYATARELTVENAGIAQQCVAEDGERVVQLLVELRDRAPKLDPVLFVLALVFLYGQDAAKAAAVEAVPQLCRTASQLFSLLDYLRTVGKLSGRAVRRAIRAWYANCNDKRLVYQVTKYGQRAGFTHADAIRLGHVPAGDSPVRAALYGWLADPDKVARPTTDTDEVFAQLEGAWQLAHATDAQEAAALIREHKLTREAVPTQLLREVPVWEALLEDMPYTAMVRNLGVMTNVGLIAPLSNGTATVTERLADPELVQRAKVHPVQLLSALATYRNGRGLRGKLRWQTVRPVADALDSAFYASFDNVEPTGKRYCVGIDVSASMTAHIGVAGMEQLTASQAAACMAMVTVRTEPQVHIMGYDTRARDVDVGRNDSLDAVMRKLSFRGGGTDCAQPMLYASASGIGVDVFYLLTDNETWAGSTHPVQALQQYRDRFNKDAKLATVAFTATGYSVGGRGSFWGGRTMKPVADPNDRGTLDLVGFDTAAPQVLAEFAKGTL